MRVFHAMGELGVDGWDKIASIFQALFVLAGGGFAIWKFHRFTETAARLTFKVDLVPALKLHGKYICEVTAEIENVGKVPVKVPTMKFSLHGLQKDDPLEERKDLKNSLDFPHRIKTGTWTKDSYIEAQSSQQFSHVCAVPAHFAAVLVFGRILYEDSNQTAQKIVVLGKGE